MKKIAFGTLMMFLLGSGSLLAQKATFYMAKMGYGYGMPTLELKNFGEITTKSSHFGYFYAGYENRFAERFAWKLDGGLGYQQNQYSSKLTDIKQEFLYLRTAFGLKIYPLYEVGLFAGVYGDMALFYNPVKFSNKISNGSSIEHRMEKETTLSYGLRFGLDYHFAEDWAVEAFYDMGMPQKIRYETDGNFGKYTMKSINLALVHQF